MHGGLVVSWGLRENWMRPYGWARLDWSMEVLALSGMGKWHGRVVEHVEPRGVWEPCGLDAFECMEMAREPAGFAEKHEGREGMGRPPAHGEAAGTWAEHAGCAKTATRLNAVGAWETRRSGRLQIMRMNGQIHEEEDANHAHKPYKEGPARQHGSPGNGRPLGFWARHGSIMRLKCNWPCLCLWDRISHCP